MTRNEQRVILPKRLGCGLTRLKNEMGAEEGLSVNGDISGTLDMKLVGILKWTRRPIPSTLIKISLRRK